MDQYRLFIGNKWQDLNSGEWFDTLETVFRPCLGANPERRLG